DYFGAAQGLSQVSLAVGGSTGKVYAGEFFGSVVDIYGPAVVIPDVSAAAATNPTPASVTMNGVVDPAGGGEVTECHFEYGPEAGNYDLGSAPCLDTAGTEVGTHANPIVSPAEVHANIAGLTQATTYHYRLVAANINGAAPSNDGTATTSGSPSVDSESSTPITTTAVLSAQIDPFGLDTTCEVQYVDEQDFNSSGYANAITEPCVPGDLGAGFGDRGATVTITGLHTATAYHYRFIATNQIKVVEGADRTFSTFGIESFVFEDLDQEGHPFT